MKLSTRHGISIPAYLTIVGSTVLLAGIVAAIATHSWKANIASGLASAGMGLVWSCAVAAMAYGMSTLKLPVSIAAPLSNCNALVAVLLSALLFKEWQTLNVTKVLAGTCFIVIGASIVSTANSQ
jgi:uncharacterized membrane protein